MDGLVALGLLLAAAFLLGPIAFFMSLGHGQRLANAERETRVLRDRLAALETRASPPPPSTAAAASVAETVAPPAAEPAATPPSPPRPTEISRDEIPPEHPPATWPEFAREQTIAQAAKSEAEDSPAEPAPALARETAPAPSLEEALGARWTVWVGGVALALGALLLVRYSIQQGFFGPGLRTLMGLALALALVGAGEWLRRREGAALKLGGVEVGANAAYIPGVLTAAGTIAAFGSIYAAYALYGFIGPAFAFLALGATGLAAMAAAALHGPALAGLGLVGSLAAPLLVASQRPNPWPAVVYLAVVVAASYWLARLRLWLWLALCGAAGGALWSLILHANAVETASTDSYHAAVLCFIVQMALAAYFLGLGPNRRANDAAAALDKAATGALAAMAAVGVLVFHIQYTVQFFDIYWIAAVASAVALLAFAGAAAAPVAAASALSGALVLAATILWPPEGGVHAFAHGRLLDPRFWLAPTAPGAYFVFSAVLALGAAAVAGKRLLDGPNLSLPPAALYAGAAAATPLGALVVADLRLSSGAASWPMAAAAALLAALFAGAATAFHAAPTADDSPATRLGLGAMAASAIAALAAGLVFALDGGALTVSLALAALGAAFVATRLDIPALRWCVAALGVGVAARLAWEPRIVGGALSPTPIFNWLLFGYGVPAAAFALAARLLRERRDDTTSRVADALAILFAAFLVFFEIRHAMNGGDPYARGSGLLEQALMTISSLGFALTLTRLDAGRANIVFRFASLAAGALGMALGALALFLRYNPFLDGEPVEGGSFVNALLPAYLLPALLAAALSLFARSRRPVWYWGGAGALAALLATTYVFLQLRVFFHGAAIGVDEGFTLSELGLDAALCLALSIAAVAAGASRGVLNAAAKTLFAASAAIGVFGLAGFENPLFTDEPVAGEPVFNALLVAYALPALLTAVLARRARRASIAALGASASVAAILWLFAYASLETRRAFQGASMGLDRWPGDGEWYAYSAVWLLLGLALLGYGVWRGSREARYASAFFVIATTLKVFLFDLAGLEGILRAVSFMGLGLALIGIGLVYQKLVFARAPSSSPSRAGRPV